MVKFGSVHVDEVLGLTIETDLGPLTVRQLLMEILRAVWIDEGRTSMLSQSISRWKWYVYVALADAGIVEADKGEDGWYVSVDTEWADTVILSCLHKMQNYEPQSESLSK